MAGRISSALLQTPVCIILQKCGFLPFARHRRASVECLLPKDRTVAERTDRRHFLTSTVLGTAGAGALLSLEEKALQAAVDREPKPGEPRRPVYQGETLPCGKIGKLSIGRLLMGGNLIGGYAHSRDLLYVSRLLREYNTDSKIFETFELAEQSGINMIQVSSGSVDFSIEGSWDRWASCRRIAHVRRGVRTGLGACVLVK